MRTDKIVVRGAREHNLKNINVEIPRDKFVVITGLSGSGKSSLAFDTIYAEGQRRYVESLSSYARQFLGQMEKPDIDYIEGLSPAVSIDQKTTGRNPRSTVGTVTEIHDYFRLMYARIGIPHCPICGKVIEHQTVDQMCDEILKLPEGTKIQLMAPIVKGRKGEYSKQIEGIRKSGYVRIRIDGEIFDLQEHTEPFRLEKNFKHDIEVIVDRLVIKESIRSRLSESIEKVLELTTSLVLVDVIGGKEVLFSNNYSCPDCGVSIPELSPRMFSFNNPLGACDECTGLGSLLDVDPELVIPNPKKSLDNGALAVNGYNLEDKNSYSRKIFDKLAQEYGFSLSTPFREYSDKIKDIILNGVNTRKIKFEGVAETIKRRHKYAMYDNIRQYYEGFMSARECPVCKGARLKKEMLAVTIGGKNIHEVSAMPIAKIKKFFDELVLSEREKLIAKQILKEINSRLQFLLDVGLEYLTLTRSAGTLSGGESQRIRLATQIGSGLMGVLYILDEPSIGLHQRDNEKLLNSLKKMRDLGNTLIVVEHDEDTMYAADHIIDMGPGAGEHGGYVIAEGNVEAIKDNHNSITGQYLSGKKKIEVPKERKKGSGEFLSIYGGRINNLKNVNVDFPLKVLTWVTGVSGSGKSSLVNEILYKVLAKELNHAKYRVSGFDEVRGLEHLDKVINIDQSPIGRTPRSNPATYTGLFDLIRDVFAMTPEAKARGYKKGRFSFNVSGGRCEACKGDGLIKIEMHFWADIYVPCEVCKGARYNYETLQVKYKGKSISDVLEMTVEEAYKFFENHPKLKRKLQTLLDVGLGYIKLGQSSTTLSGGEAQRVKLATELSKSSTGDTVYILDEPTTGLHIADVHRLIDILHRLVESGNTVIVIEHNLDVIKTADYIIDIGPEGGENGGQIIAKGTPEEIIKVKKSYTGSFLKKFIRS